MTKYLDNIGLAALWQKIKQSTSEVIICQSGEYDTVTLMPTIQGAENNIYLVPYSTESNVAVVGSAIVGQATVGGNGSSNFATVGTAIVGSSVIGNGNTNRSGALVGTAIVGQSIIGDLGQQDNIDTNNQYQEWIFKNSRFERIGERIANDKDITDMLEELGFIETVALIDSAIIDEAVVG